MSVSLNPAKLPELAELLPLDCRSCAPGDNSSTAPMLALGARGAGAGAGAGAGLDEDDYNSNTHSLNTHKSNTKCCITVAVFDTHH